jgi:hypothetical protein
LSVIFEERYQIEDFANLKIFWPLPFWFLNFMPNNFYVKILKIVLKFMLKIILLIFEKLCWISCWKLFRFNRADF